MYYELGPEARQRLRDLQEARGYSDRDVARLTGLGRGTIRRAHDPTDTSRAQPTTVRKLTELYGVSIKHILRGTEDTSPDPAPRKRLLPLGAAAVLIAAGWWIIGPSGARHPVSPPEIQVEGGLVRVQVDGRHAFHHETAGKVSMAKIAPWDDGQSYVVFTSHGPASDTSWTYCGDLRSGKLVWQWPVTREELQEFFRPEHLAEGSMWCTDLEFADLEGDGEPELVVPWRHETWLPSEVRIHDRAGSLRGRYSHYGILHEAHVLDRDGDGREEILLLGTNNALHHQGGTLVLLDAESCNGASVDEPDPARGLADSSRIRLIFPAPSEDVLSLLGCTRLHASDFRPTGAGADMELSFMVGCSTHSCYYVISLDSELRLLRMQPNDPIRRRAVEASLGGEVTEDPSSAAFVNHLARRTIRFEVGRRTEALAASYGVDAVASGRAARPQSDSSEEETPSTR